MERRTRFPGVFTMPDGRYRLRAKYRDPRTGKSVELDRRCEAPSAQAAAQRRADLIEEARAGCEDGRCERIAGVIEEEAGRRDA